jgi:hypothetical protein
LVIWNDTSAQDDGEWHHWVVYADTNNVTNSKLYVDGVLQTVSYIDDSGSLNAYSESLTIGSDRQVGGNSFEGKIDEFAVYDRELTQAEITRMYNTYYSPNRVANGNFAQIGNEEVTNGDFSQIGSEIGDLDTITNLNGAIITRVSGTSYNATSDGTGSGTRPRLKFSSIQTGKAYKLTITPSNQSGTIKCSVNNDGTYLTQFNDLSSNLEFYFVNGSNFRIFFDGTETFNVDFTISLKEVGQDWQLQYTGTGDWSITDKLNFENVNGGSAQLNVFEVGKTYKITVDYVFTSGTRLILPYDGSNFPTGGVITTTGSVNGYTYYYTPNSTTLLIYSDGNGNGSVDNISVKEVGQHWTIGGDDITIDDSKASFVNADTNTDFIQQNNIAVVGRTYKVSFDVSNLGVGESVKLRYPFQNTSANANGSYSFVAEALETYLRITPNSTNGTFDIDNIVVQELKHDATNLMLNAGDYQSANPLITSTKSMEFDGVDDYLEVQDDSSLQLEGSEASWTFWTRLDSLSGGDQKFIAKATTIGGANAAYQIRTDNADLKFQFFSGAWRTVTSSSFFTDLNWVNVTVTIDASNIVRIYKNGVETLNSNIGYSIPANTGEMLFGARTPSSPTNFLNGEMTEVGIYNRCLTQSRYAY